MSNTSHRVEQGDTFELIARRQYGDEKQATLIASANPGAAEPLVPGTEIAVPEQPGAPRDIPPQAAADSPNEVAILIDGQRFRYWGTARIVRSIDAMDVLEFTAPFEPGMQTFRDTFRPFSYKPVTVLVGGDTLFTGTAVGVTPFLDSNRRSLTVSAYSRPGVLNDCTAPASDEYQVEFLGQGLRDIAARMAQPFGIAVKVEGDQGPTFDIVAARTSEKVLTFLTKLAQQRNLIISSDENGALLIQQSISGGRPVAVLRQGSSPVLAVTPFFNPQDYYSHVTGIDPVIVGLGGSQFTVTNSRLKGVVRPITFDAPDSADGSINAAVQAKAGRMFGNAASYSVEVSTWRDQSGALWKPNTSIKLHAPGAMIYSSYEFIIRSVTFSKEPASEMAVLNLVIPGAFSGEIPEALPWDE
ncbi:MAG: hypothetical protein GY811_04515 [Myxococcales bacterium]|nr:hypothetical protein [Myxococcales bacterium]